MQATPPEQAKPADPITSDGPLPEWQKTIPTLHRLHHSQAQRCLWALEELHAHNGLKFTVINYPRAVPRNEFLKKVSPLGKSPIVTIADLEGNPVPNIQVADGVLMESRLIIEYFAEHYGGKELWEGTTDAERRRDNYFRTFSLNTLTDRVDQVLVVDIIPGVLPFPLSTIMKLIFSPVVNALKGFLPEFLEFVEVSLTDDNPWFSGSKLGVADFCMEFPVSVMVGRGYLDAQKYPKFKAWHERITGREPWKKAIEKSGGDKNYELRDFGMKG
jgi:glutathione S-transferase